MPDEHDKHKFLTSIGSHIVVPLNLWGALQMLERAARLPPSNCEHPCGPYTQTRTPRCRECQIGDALKRLDRVYTFVCLAAPTSPESPTGVE